MFVSAVCHTEGCGWNRRDDSTDEREGAKVLQAGRLHAKRRSHYVQVEKGQLAIYGAENAAA